MKIFSTFDTNLKAERLKTFQERFGIENVHMLLRSQIFRWVNVFLPLLQGILFTAVIVLSIGYLFDYTTYYIIWGVLIGTLLGGIFYVSAFKMYLDYTMDYCIITPEEVILTEQEGILKRSVRTLDVAKVKSIYINKQKLLYSIFDAGTIVFMSDGDEKFGEIVFNFIRDPESQKDIIQRIMEQNQYRKDLVSKD